MASESTTAVGDAKVVYFGGVAREATDDEFKAVAARGGRIAAVERRRGYAYVTYATVADADAAVTALNGTELAGRKMTVEKSKPAAERPERPAREPAPIGDRPVHKNRIVVRNLPREFDADALQKSFIHFGAITKARMSAGLGRVAFETDDSAAKALALSGQKLGEREIRVEYELVRARKARKRGPKAAAEEGAAAPAPRERRRREEGAEDKPARDPAKTLWLTGLGASHSEEGVRALVAPFGAVASVELLSRGRKSAYVTFEREGAVDAAASALTGKAVEGGIEGGIKAEAARPAAPRAPRTRAPRAGGEGRAAAGAGRPAAAAPAEPRAPREVKGVRVDGVPEGATPDQLKTALAAAGRITGAKVIEGRGHGFVTFEDAAAAKKATTLAGLAVNGAPLAISLDEGRRRDGRRRSPRKEGEATA